jgi:hypothetical protein
VGDLALTVYQTPTGDAKCAANQSAKQLCESLASSQNARIVCRDEAAAKRTQVPMPERRNRAQHGHGKPKVLHDDRGVLNATTCDRTKQYFYQRNDSH